ncbi:MAG: hypothetical protein Q7K98_03395 [Candidatus Omnitrophota bacterium]|nr:hypothetical protein [Candidatus Omnitrophota bacterium]
MNKIGLSFLVILLTLSGSVATAELPSHSLLKQAESQRAQRLSYAKENHARIELTSDGKSFYVLWFPEGASPANPPPMIVTLHGHDSWAFDEFYLWHQAAKERGYGILAIQWWLGQGEKYQDYLNPQEIYRVIGEVLTREQVKPGTVLFHGFSRGSANTYAVAALDRVTGKNYFALIVANAGKASSDFPPNREIEEGRFGQMPLQGTHWVTFAGGHDPHPERSGIAGMREAAEWIRRYGGVIDRAIEDENAGHGGFHQNPDNMNSALEVFKKRLKEEK